MNQSLFTDNTFSAVLRLYIPYWNEEQIRREALQYCRECNIRDVLLFTDAQYIVWNQLNPQEIERERAVWKRSVDFFRKQGFKTIGFNCSLMQMPDKCDHRSHMDYDYWLTSADGSCLHNLPCSMDPKLADYTVRFFSAVAGTGADYLLMDDDLRYMNTGKAGAFGCFCPLHLQRFSELTGKNWLREELQKCLMLDSELRRQWLDFCGGVLENLAGLIGRSTHAVNPRMHTGLMVPCVNGIPLSGNDFVRTVNAISDGNQPLLRPCICPYDDKMRHLIFAGLFHLDMISRIWGETDVDYVPELETSPSTAVSKSATVARFCMIQALLHRMSRPLFTTVGYTGDSPYVEPRYHQMLIESKNYFDTLHRHAPNPRSRKGIGLFSNLQAVRQYDETIGDINDLYLPACVVHDQLDSCGIPLSYEPSSVSFLCGIHAAGVSDAHLEQLLSGGLFLDAKSATILVKRGFGELIGLKSIGAISEIGSEQCVMPEIFEEYTGSFLQTRLLPAEAFHRLTPLPGAEEVSAFYNLDQQRIAPAVLRFRNRLGGKIVVLPYELKDTYNDQQIFYLICRQHRRMWQKLTDWMDAGLRPVRFEDGLDIVVQYYEDSEQTTLVLTNIAYDVYDSRRMTTSLNLESAEVIAEDGSLRPLNFKNGMLRERLEPFRPLVILIH